MFYLAGIAIVIIVLLLLLLLKGGPGIFFIGGSSLLDKDKKMLVGQWNRVKELASLGKPSQLKEAVITADKIVDHTLKLFYPKIEKSVDRYKKAEEFFPNREDYNDLWFAHKVRNELAHSLDFELPAAQAYEVIAKYEQSLKILGVLS